VLFSETQLYVNIIVENVSKKPLRRF